MTEKIIFTPTEEDLRAAYGLHLKQMGWKRLGYLLLFGLAIGLAMAAYDGFENLPAALGLIVGMTIWAGIVALAMTILIPIWWVPRLSRKIYKQQKDLRLETTSWWDDDKLYSGKRARPCQPDLCRHGQMAGGRQNRSALPFRSYVQFPAGADIQG